MRIMGGENPFDVLRNLENTDFIYKLLEVAERDVMPLRMARVLLDEAAKRIEDIDERISIMTEPKCGEDYCGIEE